MLNVACVYLNIGSSQDIDFLCMSACIFNLGQASASVKQDITSLLLLVGHCPVAAVIVVLDT